MKLASFRHENVATYGACEAGSVIPVPGGFRNRYPDLRSVLAAGRLDELRQALGQGKAVAADAVSFLPVIPEPGRILCVGVNYLAHVHEMGREKPDYPTLFVRYPQAMVGHEQPLLKPRVSGQYDYEGELAFVMGRAARYVKAADALAYVAGYTCFLDGSVRDFQRHTSQFLPGKNFPRSGSVGPWLVTTDEIPDPARLALTTRVNGEVLQSAPVSDLCITVPQIIEYCSTFCGLEPGDIIATGTPSGVGFARKPPRWLQPQDVVEVDITGIGTLRNQVVAET